MTKFTKEQLIARVKQATAINRRRISANPDAIGLVMDNELFAIALAALTAGMEQEPIYQLRDVDWYDTDKRTYDTVVNAGGAGRIVYAAPQLPQPAVVVDERAAFNAWNNEDNLPIAGVGAKNAAWLAWQARATLCGNSVLDVPPERPADSSSGDDVEAWFDEGWNACRAAMLHGAEPAAILKPSIFIDGNISPDDADKLADAISKLNSEHRESQQIIAESVSQPYTLRDGWVAVPVDMTPEQMRAVQLNSELGSYASANMSGAYSLFREFWDVAIAAAQQQEEDSE